MAPAEPLPDAGRPAPLTGFAARLFRALLPHAERDEVLTDLGEEYLERRAARGAFAARMWLWRQLLLSLPALLRRTWWRGWTGFEPRANRLRSGGPLLESWIIDLRFSARRLATRPTYTALAVLTLALGVGGTAAIYSVVQALLLDPLPIPREAEVGVFWMEGSWTEQEFLHLRPEFPGFAHVAAYRSADGTTLDMPGQPLRLLRGISASAELFEVLGATAFLGRTFQTGDDVAGAEPVVVLSHRFWHELGGDPSLIGRQLLLGGSPHTVVGVMPAGFWFPTPETQVWVARVLNPEREVGELTLVGRAAAGRPIGVQTDASLAAIVAALRERFQYDPGEWDKTRAPAITPLRDYLVGDVRPGLMATFIAMALILFIACVNVSALMLGQLGGRSGEMAVRAALGAGRHRLTQQLVAEALVVGLLAGLAGALLATASFGLLVNSLPLGALAETATLDWMIFAAALAIALPASAAIALVPSLALLRSNLHATMATTRSSGLSARGGRLEAGLVVTQIAVAVLLTAGAALLLQTVSNLRAIDAGIEARGVAVIDATVPTQMTHEERQRTYLGAVASLETLPGVRAAAATQRLPLLGSSDNWGIDIQGRPDLGGTTTAVRLVTRNYFETMGIAIRQGRAFEPTDAPGTPRVVVINEALAARYFPGEDPIGRVVHTFGSEGERIVGMVENVAEARLTDPPVPARYLLYDQAPGGTVPATSFVLRGAPAADEAALVAAARSRLAADAPRLAVHRLTTMQALFDEAVGPAGQVVRLVSLLAGLAILLGAIGVYGMISHYVVRRTREYGVRIALGLPPAQVVAHVVGRGLRLVTLGAVVGLLLAASTTRLLGSLLYGVAATDAGALAGAVAALVLAGTLAAAVPARRASRTDPAVVLREQ